MNFKNLSLLFLMTLIFGACVNELELQDDLRISDEEQEVLEACQKEAITTQKQIEANLIGHWKLVGYACGFCASGEVPRASASFTANSGTFTYKGANEDIDQTFTWSIVESTNIFGEEVFALKTEPVAYNLAMNNFCKDYMTYNSTPVDGPMYIYAKQ
jgi:hypothetical protein